MGRLHALCIVPLAFTLFACTYSDGHHRGYGSGSCTGNCGNGAYGTGGAYATGGAYGTGGSAAGGSSAGGTVGTSTIDTNSQVSGYAAGQGAGLFVDYSAGGIWYFTLACDTSISGSDCNWDVIATPMNATTLEFGGVTIDSNDVVESDGYNGVHANTITGNEFDEFYLTTTPGMSVTVDALLDGLSAERYIYWNGGGGLHRGAPVNMIELVPSAP